MTRKNRNRTSDSSGFITGADRQPPDRAVAAPSLGAELAPAQPDGAGPVGGDDFDQAAAVALSPSDFEALDEEVDDEAEDEVEEAEDEDGVFNALCLALEQGESMTAADFAIALAGGDTGNFEGVQDARLALLLSLVTSHGEPFITAERALQAAREVELDDLIIEAREVVAASASLPDGPEGVEGDDEPLGAVEGAPSSGPEGAGQPPMPPAATDGRGASSSHEKALQGARQ